MEPIIDPFLSGGRLALSDLIRMVNRDRVDSSTVNIKLIAKIGHAHRRAFDVPAGESPAPGRWPHHLLFTEFALGEPKNEVFGVLLVFILLHPLPDRRFQPIELEAGELAVIIDRVDREVHVSPALVGMPLFFQTENQIDHLLDVVGRLAGRARSNHLQIVKVPEERIGVILCDLPRALLLFPGGFFQFVLTVIAIPAQMADIGNVHHVGHLIPAGDENPLQEILEQEGSKVSDVGIVIDGGTAAIHPRFFGGDRDELFDRATHCIIQAKRHDKLLWIA